MSVFRTIFGRVSLSRKIINLNVLFSLDFSRNKSDSQLSYGSKQEIEILTHKNPQIEIAAAKNANTNTNNAEYIPWSKKVPNRLSLLDDVDFEEFVNEFPLVVNDLLSLKGLEEMHECNEWMRTNADYNVPHGKLLRASIIISMAKAIQKRTLKELPNLYRIAWAYEFFQASAVIIDDIVDKSKTRRDQPCWYLASNKGLASVFDGILLENACFILSRQYTRNHYDFHYKVIDLILEASFKGYYGQMQDAHISKAKSWYTVNADMYYKLMTLKNAFQAFIAPILIGLLLNGINDPKTFKTLEKLGSDILLLYAVQDDYIDCFVGEENSGKMGTDIQNGKPSWLIITALERANEEQRRKLMISYGKDDLEHANVVKKIYEEIGIPRICSEYEEKSYRNLMVRIDELPLIVPKGPLRKLLKLLFRRTR